MLDRGEGCESSDLHFTSQFANALQFRNVANIEHILRLEEFLLHRRNKVCATGDDSGITGMLLQEVDCFGDTPRVKQLELRQGQSAPPGWASRREGSSGC